MTISKHTTGLTKGKKTKGLKTRLVMRTDDEFLGNLEKIKQSTGIKGDSQALRFAAKTTADRLEQV